MSPVIKTIGMVVVAALAASTEGLPPEVAITSTRRCTWRAYNAYIALKFIRLHSELEEGSLGANNSVRLPR
jgi:hypothetical protein